MCSRLLTRPESGYDFTIWTWGCGYERLHNHADFLRHEGNGFIQREGIGIRQCPCHYIGMAHDYHLSANAKVDFFHCESGCSLLLIPLAQDYYIRIYVALDVKFIFLACACRWGDLRQTPEDGK